MTYHEQAQKYINSSKSLGYSVKAEDGELIAYPPNYKKKKPQRGIDMLKDAITSLNK